MGSTRHPIAFEKAVEGAKVEYKGAYVLIGDMNHLYEYVVRFSDLAWDIAEGSEKALLIWYQGGKDVPEQLKDEQGYVAVMMNRCEGLQPLLKKLGHGLFSLLLPPSEEGWLALKDVLPLSLNKECKLLPERIMRLGTEGDVKFLKY